MAKLTNTIIDAAIAGTEAPADRSEVSNDPFHQPLDSSAKRPRRDESEGLCDARDVEAGKAENYGGK